MSRQQKGISKVVGFHGSNVVVSMVLFLGVLGSHVQGELTPRTPIPKRPYQLMPNRPHRMVVKFVDDMQARCQQGVLSSPEQAMLDEVDAVVETYNLLFTKLIGMPYAQLTQLEQRAAARSGDAQPDLGGMMVVHFPQWAAEQDVADDLLLLDEVEFCVSEALDTEFPADIPPTTALLEFEQGYRGPDPGMDMDYVWSKTPVGVNYDGRGKGITLTDVEGDWSTTHEDLVDRTITFINTPDPSTPPNELATWHGTNSIGITSAVDNAYGCTGLVPDAALQVSTVFLDFDGVEGQNRELAFLYAIRHSDPGDVIMLELQGGAVGDIEGCSVGAGGGGPIELDEPMWCATRLAVDTDIVVVAAAGNKGIDLDGPEEVLASWRARGDSGAIIVGGGSPDVDHRWFCGEFGSGAGSSYGGRVDVQGWYAEALTTGCESLTHVECVFSFGDGLDQDYSLFGGTSAATPQIAGACVALQGFFRDRLGMFFDLTADDGSGNALRDLLSNTGTPQGGLPGEDSEDHHVGPYPNLRTAIDTVLNDPSVALPFEDVFPAEMIDEVLWPVATGFVDDLGDGEPSPPYSMHLGPGEFFESASMVTTEACTANSTIQLELSFWAQDSLSVPPGVDLVVTYRDDAGIWQPFLTAPDDDGISGYVELVGNPTAGDALHDAFRVRFENPSTTGDWFVDDVQISILTAPDFQLTPFTQEVCEGDQVDFEVEATGGNLAYQWRKDGQVIPGATDSTYTISSSVGSDSGDYTVVVTNDCSTIGVESTPGELTVQIPTALGAITLDPPAQPVECGASVMLNITATGDPLPVLQWQLDGNAIEGATSSSYSIPSVTLADEGDYTVIATNAAACGGGTVTSAAFALDVDETSDCTSGPPVLVSARTVATHGAEEFSIPILLDHGTGVPTSEPRTPGVTKLQLVFDQPMDPNSTEDEDNIDILACDGQAPGTNGCEGTATDPADMSAVLSVDGLTLTVSFPGLAGAMLPDQDRYTLILSGVLDAQLDELIGDGDFDIRAVAGDANGDGIVDPLDSGYVQARLSADPEIETEADVNSDGVIDPLDVGAVNARLGGSAP